MRLSRIVGGLLLLLSAPPAAANTPAAADGLRVERAVLLMRHGVRPPTKAQPLPAGVTSQTWPRWDVAPGYLTAHGAEAVRLLGRADRARYAALLGGSACPAAGTVAVISDSDQRTIRTGDTWLEGLAPGCAIPNSHKPQDVADPLFSPVDEHAVRYDETRARAAVLAALPAGGIAALDASAEDLFQRLDRIYGCCKPVLCTAPGPCSFVAMGSDLAPVAPGKRPKLVGALDLASTAAHILLLEYADGKPVADVGWGRATAADITALSRFHALEFAVVARPRYVAAANIAPIVQTMLAALTAPTGAAVTMLAGHDTNVASLGGLLGLHWQAPGYAADDPPPGGAIILERLRDAKGNRFVRAIFRAQPLEQTRTLAAGAPYETVMPIEGCKPVRANACALADFEALVRQRIADVVL